MWSSFCDAVSQHGFDCNLSPCFTCYSVQHLVFDMCSRICSAADKNCLWLQQIYEEGLYHPSVTTSITSSLFYPYNFSTADVLNQTASQEAGFICTCGEFYDNPCRMEIRAVSLCSFLLSHLFSGAAWCCYTGYQIQSGNQSLTGCFNIFYTAR